MDKWNTENTDDEMYVDELKEQALCQYCQTHYLPQHICVCGEHKAPDVEMGDIDDIDHFYAWENLYVVGHIGTEMVMQMTIGIEQDELPEL